MQICCEMFSVLIQLLLVKKTFVDSVWSLSAPLVCWVYEKSHLVVTCTGFVHFFVNRIQDFFQTFSRPFFLFSRLKITVKFFMAREEIIVLIMKTTNKKRKKNSFSCLVLNLQWHLLLFEKNSRLHPIFQDFAFNFHTFSRSGKVVRKFPDFFKNSRLCTNPACSIGWKLCFSKL